jgi:hypothetical protein
MTMRAWSVCWHVTMAASWRCARGAAWCAGGFITNRAVLEAHAPKLLHVSL